MVSQQPLKTDSPADTGDDAAPIRLEIGVVGTDIPPALVQAEPLGLHARALVPPLRKALRDADPVDVIAVVDGDDVAAVVSSIRAGTDSFDTPLLLFVDRITVEVAQMMNGLSNTVGAEFALVRADAPAEELAAQSLALVHRHRRMASPAEREATWRLSILESLLDSFPDLVALVDRDGRHLMFNRAARRLLKVADSVPLEELDARAMTPPDTLDFLSTTVFPTMRSEGWWAGSVDLLARDGERIPVHQQWFTITDPTEQQVFTATTAHDLRDRIRMDREIADKNRALAEESERFNTIMRSTPDLVAFADLDGRLTRLNPAGRALLGVPEDTAPTELRLGDIHPPDVAVLIENVAIPMALERGSWSGETAVRTADGIEVPTWQVLIAVNEPAERSQSLVTFVRDLRELRSLQSQVEMAQEARARAEADEMAKTRFLATMSHEIRTPLNAVLGYAQLLELDGLAPDQAEAVRSIRRAGSHLLALVHDVLDLSRIEAGGAALRPEPTDLHRLVGDMSQLAADACRNQGLAWESRIDLPTPFMVMADRQRLTQIMSNLLDNAVKFTEEGGVDLAVRQSHVGDVVIEVSDTGPGMSVEELTSLFAPFTQGENRHNGGAGLGLAITRKLVTAMGGSIRMTLRPEGGVRAVVSLPLRLTDSNQDARRPFGPSDAGAGRFVGLTAVVADDIDDNREALALLLERAGVEVMRASGSDEMLRYLESSEPHVAFVDLRMGSSDGMQAVTTATSRWPQRSTLYVAVTATGISLGTSAIARYGFAAMVNKPFNFADIEVLLERAALRKEEAGRAAAQPAPADVVPAPSTTNPVPGSVVIDVGNSNPPPEPVASGPVPEGTATTDDTAEVGGGGNRVVLPEPFRSDVAEAASLGRVIRVRQLLVEVTRQLNEGVLDPAETDLAAVRAEVAHLSAMADSYELERVGAYLAR